MTPTESLLEAEHRLQDAQRSGDVTVLDELLADALVAIGPDGQVSTKADDLGAHRSGTSVVTRLVEESLQWLVEGRTGVTFVLATVEGEYAGAPFDARLRYTRTWVCDEQDRWRVVAAHISPVPADR